MERLIWHFYLTRPCKALRDYFCSWVTGEFIIPFILLLKRHQDKSQFLKKKLLDCSTGIVLVKVLRLTDHVMCTKIELKHAQWRLWKWQLDYCMHSINWYSDRMWYIDNMRRVQKVLILTWYFCEVSNVHDLLVKPVLRGYGFFEGDFQLLLRVT